MQSATTPIDVPQEETGPRFIAGEGDHEDTILDLNDHRLQSSSLPRNDNFASPRPRRGTLASIYDGQPDLLRVDQSLLNEEAIVVDDDGTVVPTRDESHLFIRRGSTSPVVARRSTVRRQRPNLSRNSSTSSSSSSERNSVHAFAAGYRRRQRGATVNSKAASSVDLPLKRTTSGGSHSRRPTFSGRDETKRGDDDEGHSSAEEDVCYPRSDSRASDNYSIAYSELEELVEEQEAARQAREGPALQTSPIHVRPASPNTPRIHLEAPTPDRHPSLQGHSSDEDFDELEKHKFVRRTSTVEEPQTSKADLAKRWWTFFSSELDDTIHARTIGGLLEEGENFQQLFAVRPEGGCWWLDSLNPTDDEVNALCKAFGVHNLTCEDIKEQESREKVELFKTYYFVSFRSFVMNKDSEDYLEPVSCYAVVFRQGLLTFTFHQGPHRKNVLKRIGRLRDYMVLSADWICYAIIDDIVDSFMPVIREIEDEVDNIEDQIFAARDEDARPLLQKIAECRRKAMSILRVLGGKPDVIKGFAKRCNEGYSSAPAGDVALYLSDIQDHIVTMRDNLTHSEQLLSRLHNNFLAQLNVEHIASGNKVNKLLGKVTLVATILVPLNLITGLFGMNVPVPGKDSTSLGWFFGIVGIILTFIATALCVAKRFRYI